MLCWHAKGGNAYARELYFKPIPKGKAQGEKASQSRAGAHGIWDNIGYFLRYSARRYPALLCMMAVEIAAGVAAPAFGIYLPKLAADLALGQTALAPAQTALLLGGVAFIMAAVYGARDIAGRGKYMHYNFVRQDLAHEVYYKSLECDFRWWSVPRGRLGLPARR